MEDYGERLAKIELAIITLQAQVTSLHAMLLGDGRSGINIAVDRLEQAYSSMRWNYRIVMTALIGLILKTLWEIFLEQPPSSPTGWPYMGFF